MWWNSLLTALSFVLLCSSCFFFSRKSSHTFKSSFMHSCNAASFICLYCTLQAFILYKFNPIQSVSLFTFSHYEVVARKSIVFIKEIYLLILPDLHVLKLRIQKKWFLGVDMSVCLSVCLSVRLSVCRSKYLGNYLTDLDHILDLVVF